MRMKPSDIKTNIPINIEKEEFICSLIDQGYLSIDEGGRLHKNIDRDHRKDKYIDKIIDKKNKNGYMVAFLSLGDKVVQIRIHRLIWRYYYGKIPENLQINHKDVNKTNNRKENLELVTGSENIQHAIKITKKIKSNWNSNLSKYTFNDYKKIKTFIGMNMSNKEIKKIMKMKKTTFLRIKKKILKGIEGL